MHPLETIMMNLKNLLWTRAILVRYLTLILVCYLPALYDYFVDNMLQEINYICMEDIKANLNSIEVKERII